MSTFTYTIKYPDGRVEHHTGTVLKDPSASLQTDIEQGDAKIVANAARALRRESQSRWRRYMALDVTLRLKPPLGLNRAVMHSAALVLLPHRTGLGHASSACVG